MYTNKKYPIAFITCFLVYLTIFSQQPPYSGTIFIESDIISPTDTSTLKSVTYKGREKKIVFDRRPNINVQIDAYIFDITYTDGLTAQAIVNPEYGSIEAAQKEAQIYAQYTSQIPYVLKSDVKIILIHKGDKPWSGYDQTMLIHTGKTPLYLSRDIVEETIVHEATHTKLDAEHANTSEWIAAQEADNNFISTYAQDHPFREDVAETFLLWFAVTYRRDRISAENYSKITKAIPNRIAYFNNQNFDLRPLVIPTECTKPTNIKTIAINSNTISLGWSGTNPTYKVSYRVKGGEWMLAADDLLTKSLTINNLQANTTYEIDIYSKCTAGNLVSDRYTVTTPGCGTPLNITASDISDTSATINWSGKKTSNYYIYYKNTKSDWQLEDRISQNTYTLNGLTPDTAYELDVYNTCPGENKVSERFQFSTKKTIAILGTDKIADKENDYLIFPIPATNTLTIQYPSVKERTLLIHTISGKKVFSQKYNGISLKINLSEFTPGNYLITTKEHSKQHTRMFTIK